MSNNIDDLDNKIFQSRFMNSFCYNLIDYFKKNDIYIFNNLIIDNVSIYIIIYDKEKIVTFESANTCCSVQVDKKKFIQKYVLHYFQYSSIMEALQNIYHIQSEYKLYNGLLIDPESYALKQLELSMNPYKEDEICSICLDDTTNQTECNHYICYTCREKCINIEKTDCPMCRNNDALSYIKLQVVTSYNNHIKIKKALSKFNSYYNYSDDEEENDVLARIINGNENTNNNYLQYNRDIIEEGEIIEENELNEEQQMIEENEENQIVEQNEEEQIIEENEVYEEDEIYENEQNEENENIQINENLGDSILNRRKNNKNIINNLYALRILHNSRT